MNFKIQIFPLKLLMAMNTRCFWLARTILHNIEPQSATIARSTSGIDSHIKCAVPAPRPLFSNYWTCHSHRDRPRPHGAVLWSSRSQASVSLELTTRHCLIALTSNLAILAERLVTSPIGKARWPRATRAGRPPKGKVGRVEPDQTGAAGPGWLEQAETGRPTTEGE